ncbi:MAG: ATP-binding protein [Lutispora sp.]|nr:ATP-binding protein [Lutispora sp.]MDD2481471.1 ATP-binding protein [Lutispora sp.]
MFNKSRYYCTGDDKVDLIENAEFGYCSLIKATENTLNKLDIENVTKTEITSTVRKEKRLVDPTALREAVINAIIHNDYSNGIPPVFEIFSDRFVITSSGGLSQELSQEEFFEGISVPRNKELMRVFKDVKLVEQLGSGVQRILKIYEKKYS